uniref:Uncharacterized protein n=1 Tax=Octactis speculum TaxID=3111310 RepID=A0A7S2F771_9STRA
MRSYEDTATASTIVTSQRQQQPSNSDDPGSGDVTLGGGIGDFGPERSRQFCASAPLFSQGEFEGGGEEEEEKEVEELLLRRESPHTYVCEEKMERNMTGGVISMNVSSSEGGGGGRGVQPPSMKSQRKYGQAVRSNEVLAREKMNLSAHSVTKYG